MPCLDISSFFNGSNNLHLISYLFWQSKCRDHSINLLDCLHQAFVMIYVSLWNNHMTFKINILIQSIKTHPQCGELEFVYTWRSVTPELLKLLMSLDSSGLEAVFSLTNAKVGCPAFALSSTMYFPMYPVPPIIKLRENFKLNGLIGFKRTRELDYRRGNSQFQTKEVRAP